MTNETFLKLAKDAQKRFIESYKKTMVDYQNKIEMLNQRPTDDIAHRRRKPYSSYPNSYEAYDQFYYQREIQNAEYWMNKHINQYAEYLL